MRAIFENKLIWAICLFSFLSALYVNELNLDYLPKELIRNGGTIITNDDPSYLAPPKNLFLTGIWKDNSIGNVAYFLRPPGYGAIYYLLLHLGSESTAIYFLKLIQLILFGFSIYWLYSISSTLFSNKKLALITTIIYGVLPVSSGFLYYTLTEGLTPAILLYYIYLLFKAGENNIVTKKRLYFVAATLIFSVLLIIRPALGFFFVLLPIFLIKNYSKFGVKSTLIKLIVYVSLAFSLTIAWQIRNYNITGNLIGFHPIYQNSNNSIYRPTFKHYWNFSSGWAQEGKIVHSYMYPMWDAAIKGDTSMIYIHSAINTFPNKVINHYGKERLIGVFRNYQTATLHQKSYYDKGLAMPNEIPEIENRVIDDLKRLTAEFKSKFWIDYYLISPAKVFKVMAFHSNLNLYIFQHTYRGNPIIESLRYLAFTIHSLCFILLIISLFLFKSLDWRLSTLILTSFGYIFYLCYFQRGIEERYTLPILAILLIIALETGKQLINKLR